MKTAKYSLILILVLACVGFAEPLDTYHSDWKMIRNTADEDGATFEAVYDLTTAGNFKGKDSSTVASGGPYQIRSYPGTGIGTEFQTSGGAWKFAICAKNYDVGADNVIDNTLSFTMIGWAKDNGMLQVIGVGDCVLGTQAVVTYPVDSSYNLDTDADGALVSETAVEYTHASETYTVTNEGFDGTVAGMMAYVTGTNLTDGYYAVTTVTDSNNIIMSGMDSSNNNTDSTVEINPAFWCDTINLDETTKWPSIAVFNSGDNQMAFIVADMTGIEWVQFVVYDATPAQTLEAGDVTVYGRPY